MRLREKLCVRKLRQSKWRILCAILITVLYFLLPQKSSTREVIECGLCAPIDVVYTWVNGSEPAFVDAARSYDRDYDSSRFDDKNELRYSLRSLEMYAPWIRHVYIVTNGQIPYWLDLSYKRVTIVPHEVLAPHSEWLPTFSSAAIETFLHRIPNLSARFLYMNDDIFLGAPLYPEDLYTDSEGVRVYQAWLVPDCAEDCTWTYIGDGACDHHCNIAACQYDGGDCSADEAAEVSRERTEEHDILPAARVQQLTVNRTSSRGELHKFPKREKLQQLWQVARNTSFKNVMRQHGNLTSSNDLRRIVESFNNHLRTKVQRPAQNTILTEAPPPFAHQTSINQQSVHSSSKDIFSQSLIHTNMLLNRHYGFKARNIMAHVGFLLERSIIDEMQSKFRKEVLATAAHRFRSADDLQFAFAYYSFLMSETRNASVEEIFDEFDTDGSETWSDREIRTLLARTFPLPLDWSAIRFFEEVITNCTREHGISQHPDTDTVHPTLVYERYEDSNLPTVTRELVAKCGPLVEALVANFGVRPKYKFEINSKRTLHNNFMMLTSNVTEVVDALDKMRRTPRKFNCINDNLDAKSSEDKDLVRQLLQDFYLSFFPRRSKFELQPEYRNRFTNWRDYQHWRRRKRAALAIGYTASVILILFLLRFLCLHKTKIVRRCIQKL